MREEAIDIIAEQVAGTIEDIIEDSGYDACTEEAIDRVVSLTGVDIIADYARTQSGGIYDHMKTDLPLRAEIMHDVSEALSDNDEFRSDIIKKTLENLNC